MLYVHYDNISCSDELPKVTNIMSPIEGKCCTVLSPLAIKLLKLVSHTSSSDEVLKVFIITSSVAIKCGEVYGLPQLNNTAYPMFHEENILPRNRNHKITCKH